MPASAGRHAAAGRAASMSGFVIFDYANRYPEGVAQLAKWLNIGQLRSHEHVEHGDLGNFPGSAPQALWRREHRQAHHRFEQPSATVTQ
jgi:NADPH-dependent curcumin reductase CurA